MENAPERPGEQRKRSGAGDDHQPVIGANEALSESDRAQKRSETGFARHFFHWIDPAS